MNIITCQVGQCGNQVGETILDALYHEALLATEAHQAMLLETFFQENNSKTPVARSVLIDMEPKVVNTLLEKNKKWEYNSKFSFCKQEGSGNNWAFGYNFHGPSCTDEFENIFHAIAESCDYINGFFIYQSLAGGTGSGVGSFLVEFLKEYFGNKSPVLNFAIFPHLSGEVILQYYNSMLTLAVIQENSDGVLIFDNENLINHCKALLHLDRPNFKEINSVLAQQMNSILFPILEQGKAQTEQFYSPFQSSYKYIETIIDNLLFDPDYKILNLKMVPIVSDHAKSFSNESWSALESRIQHMISGRFHEYNIKWNMTKCYSKSLSNLFIYRGADINSYTPKLLKDALPEQYSQCCKVNGNILVDSHNYNKIPRSLCSLSNSQEHLPTLEKLSLEAHKMFQARAYTYQYEKYELTEDKIKEAFYIIESIISNYSMLQILQLF